MISEFKEFAMKGSLIDMAVGLVMGAAFSKVTGAFIDGMFMPIVGFVFQVGDLSKYNIALKEAVLDAAGKETAAAVSIKMGDFIGAVLNFIVVAFVMFMIIKAINKAKTPPPPAAGPTADQALLMEIRDALKK